MTRETRQLRRPCLVPLLCMLAGVVWPVVPSLRASPQDSPLVVAGEKAELTLSAISDQTVRLTLAPLKRDSAPAREEDPILAQPDWPGPKVRIQSLSRRRVVNLGKTRVTVSPHPFVVEVAGRDGRIVQRLELDVASGKLAFALGGGPVLGLGEGAPQFDRRGAEYPMKSGQGEYQLETFGGRLPIPWLIGTGGWAMFVHQPLGSFDLRGKDGHFERWASESSLPWDVFIVAAREPAQIMAEYARITGHPHLPPLWALGYQQSHRTLVSREEVLSVARTFREKKLPCDVLIYLGTGFCPSGWNTGHGSFEFNQQAFPEPAEMIRELREQNFHVALHVVLPPPGLAGSADDTGPAVEDANSAARYWRSHLEVFRLGINGWWPDESEELSVRSRLARNRMYWEGPQLERPNTRPYALHRAGYAGMQRYAWLWSGDVDSTWKTLQAQIPVGLNTCLSGVPYWGTDTGGFVTTKELTGELYVRWFQFSAFCPLFRSHGRTWKLRLPWGWNTGALGPPELEGYGRNAGVPDTKELLNPDVEPICRKYLELRYRLMPYLYTAVREAHDTGMPVMRALWLHYPSDLRAVGRGDEYLWGRDILLSPVTEKGATSRELYLPPGIWYDFWIETRMEGGRIIHRAVDLATIPLYVRAGAILPMGPVEQHTAERGNDPLDLTIYPGADGGFTLYEDDGITFDYRQGQFMRISLVWKDRSRSLTIGLKNGSKTVPPWPRTIRVRVAGEQETRSVVFGGKPVEIAFPPARVASQFDGGRSKSRKLNERSQNTRCAGFDSCEKPRAVEIREAS